MQTFSCYSVQEKFNLYVIVVVKHNNFVLNIKQYYMYFNIPQHLNRIHEYRIIQHTQPV